MESVTTAYYGVADVTTSEPVTPDTVFSVGSLTKSMVATVVARLADRGRLSLDDRVATHVPELRASGWAERASVRDLLANRSGLPLSAALEFDLAGRQDSDDGALSRLAADVAAAEVAAANVWSYTNVGWCLLGRVLESATGGTWEDALRRHVVDQAGMSRTTFATDSPPKHRASGHEITSGRPGSGSAVGRSRVWTGRNECRLDSHGPVAVRRHPPRSRVASHVAGCPGRDRDPWLVRFVVPRVGLVRLDRRPGMGVGQRHQRRAVRSPDPARPTRGRCRDDEQQHRSRSMSVAARRSDELVVRDPRTLVAPRRVTRRRGRPVALRRRLRVARPPGAKSPRLAAASCSKRSTRKPRCCRSTSGPSWLIPAIRITRP